MGQSGELINKNFKPFLPAPSSWKIAWLPRSNDIQKSDLPDKFPGIPKKPEGIKPKLSEVELAQLLLAQIKNANKLDCRGALCTMFKATDVVRKKFVKGFIHSITNPKRPIGRQNLRLGTYCSRPEDLIYGFKKLVEEGVKITVNKGGKIYHKIYFNDLQGPGTGGVFTELINKQCGMRYGLEAFYKHQPKK